MVEKSGRTTVPTVHVEADNGTLRLRWSYQRNRRSLGLGLPVQGATTRLKRLLDQLYSSQSPLIK
ncbi:hypothetical protein [Kamptonema sp. UHCC 0994]|uniref:hypothetical protein n=1 Tax=Kamptonema sp. UHCC 0994 TaxID=3031329 RepID=UPI0023B93710|nr:hypothetical protein [Kamptonema sp. UHCC 0994]MDF0554451.1 hypothetical protein [Kamptonema sp. UHCC 0994]